jgi:hypothetical protein
VSLCDVFAGGVPGLVPAFGPAIAVIAFALARPGYRADFRAWMTWQDPLGLALWRRHRWLQLAILAAVIGPSLAFPVLSRSC